MAKTYLVYNGPMVTTAAPTSVTTGTSLKTMLQIKPAANFALKVIEWGISFDGSAAATPGKIELIDTGTVFGTVTAYAAADVFPYDDPNADANTAGTSGVPINLGTSASGYTCTSEGSVTTTRYGAVALVAPTNDRPIQLPLGREFGVKAGNCLRIRVTFAAAINCLCYVVFEI